MNIIRRTYGRVENYFLQLVGDSRIIVEAAIRRGGFEAPSRQIKRSAKNLQAETLKSWKNAVNQATDPESPSRAELSRLYDNLLLDNHLASCIDSRILYVQRSAFKLVDEKGKENKDVTWMLERPWFDDLIKLVLNSRYQGTTLIELFDTNSEGELVSVDEIPQSHFIASKGLIIAEPGDERGWPYKEPPFSNYYLQVGKDNDLGMLEKLAVIILAKKLGLGSWLDYIEKFGIPPIFVTTDREDNTRLNELYEAASNFRANHFMVGRGQEKFEIGNSGGIDAYNTFDKLIERANSEISKRILGGHGMNDDSAFVGSSEIQYRLAKDRYESDKLFFKYIFNTHVKPRLITLSPVYAPLANFYFEWDNTESLSQIELVDLIIKLAAQFEISPEYVQEVTGIPIISQRNTGSVEVDDTNAQKKNSSNPEAELITLRASLNELYHTDTHICGELLTADPVAIDLSGWAATIERVAKELHEGRIKPESLDEEMILRTYQELNKAAGSGYGKDWSHQGKAAGPDPAVMRMQQNLYRFSGAKTFAELQELNRAMYNGKELVDWQTFKNSAQEINERYNLAHLQAEHQTAKQAGNHARNWKQYEDDVKLFPNLKYKTVGDSRVRDEHQKLDGIIAPVGSPFWDKYYPPNGWRCRCRVIQTAEKPSQDIPEEVAEVGPAFQVNVGKTATIFPEERKGPVEPHPYFVLSKGSGSKELRRAFELSKLSAPASVAHRATNGGKVAVNPFADLDGLPGNFTAAVKLADKLNAEVTLRPRLSLAQYNNAPLSIDGKLSDRTEVSSYQGITRALEKHGKAGSDHIVLDVSEGFTKWEPQRVYNQIKEKLLSSTERKDGQIFVVYGEQVAALEMPDFYNGSAAPLEKLKKMKEGSKNG